MRRALVCLVVAVTASARANAQMPEAIGIRAQGMGGAFTAVADDASATWWNPAGLASGAVFNTIIDVAYQREPPEDRPSPDGAVPSWNTAARGFALAYPALGLSYYRLQLSEIRPSSPIGGGVDDRQDQGSTKVLLRSLVLNEFGATVGQSLGRHVVVASTVKLVRGRAASDMRERIDASLDAAEDLEGDSHFQSSFDVGVLGSVGPLRGALVVRNINEPAFGEGEATFTLAREVRAGVAVASGRGRAIASADLDLTTRSTPLGDERRLAFGGEVWTTARTFGVRGGIGRSVIGEARGTASGGISVAVRRGNYVDVAATGGTDRGRRGWGAALRVTF